MKVNIKLTPGLMEALARIADREHEALSQACRAEAEKIHREFMAEHYDRQCLAYRLGTKL